MSAVPGPVTHPPGMYHPFDPIHCSSDAGWQMQQHAVLAQQQALVEAQERDVANAAAARNHLLLHRR